MNNRSGEKKGWLLGWLGGFIWAAILAIIFIVQGKLTQGLVGLALTAIGVAVIVSSAPWKHPGRPYWQLMLPIYAVFFAALGWAIWAYAGLQPLGLNRWAIFLVLPILLPFATGGKRTWNDGDGQ